jgi:hypothetical protein
MFDKDNPFGDDDSRGVELRRLVNRALGRKGIEKSVCFIELYKTCEDTGHDLKIGTGTGILTEYQGLIRLITCWHVVTGLHHETREWLDKKTTCHPDKLKFYFTGRVPNTDRLTFSAQMINLYSEVDGDKVPAWNVNSIVGSYYDIAVLTFNDPNNHVVPIKLSKDRAHETLEAKDSVFVLGHPIDNLLQKYMPIYKKGSIASSPALPYNWHPKFLIDATTRSGMSGSPVMLHQDPLHKGFIVGGARDLSGINVVGMYSGRADAIEKGRSTELGYVWRIDDIIDVVENGRRDVMPVRGIPIPEPEVSVGGGAIDADGNLVPPNIYETSKNDV